MTSSPPISARTIRLRSDGPESTRSMAATLAQVLVDGDLLILTGDLGAGKTCFTQGLGRGLGIDERITSPTFTLANRYRGRLLLHHLDVYRLDGVADAADLDIDELLEEGVTVIEWGDRIDGALPEARLTIGLRFPTIGHGEADADTGRGDPDPDPHPHPESDDDGDDDVRIIEIDGPVGERGLDRLLAAWLVR